MHLCDGKSYLFFVCFNLLQYSTVFGGCMKQQEVQIQNREDIQISHLLRTFIYSSHKATQTRVPL